MGRVPKILNRPQFSQSKGHISRHASATISIRCYICDDGDARTTTLTTSPDGYDYCWIFRYTTGGLLTKEDLIDRLNEDLASELGAVIMYLTYAARATGPYRPQLAQFFLAEVADEQLHAQYLSNKVVALGGEPTTVPRPVSLPDSNRGMLEEILKAEREATENYTQRAQEAEDYGDKGLVVQLEESSHVEETERILRDWPL